MPRLARRLQPCASQSDDCAHRRKPNSFRSLRHSRCSLLTWDLTALSWVTVGEEGNSRAVNDAAE
jgi:hypothetical protein